VPLLSKPLIIRIKLIKHDNIMFIIVIMIISGSDNGAKNSLISILKKRRIFLKTKDCNMLRLIILSAFLFIITGNLSALAEPVKMAIIPFKMNAEKDMTFLQNGISDMLTARLSKEKNISVINREETEKAAEKVSVPLNEEKARNIGIKLNVNYVIFGSVTIFGNSISIDAQMVDVSDITQTLNFSDQSNDAGDVIPKINLFATEISEKLNTKMVQTSESSKTSEVFKETEKKEIQSEKNLNPAFIVPEHHEKATQEFWKSQDFEYLINGMASGDVDKDGKTEVVFITPNQIYIYRKTDNSLEEVKIIEESRYKILIGIDIADINANGSPEIFITSMNSLRNSLNSMVFEWNGQEYVRIVEKSSWYYRVIKVPGEGSVLLGQQNTSYDPFSGDIVEMEWRNSDYVSKKTMATSASRSNIMGFTFGDIMNNGKPAAVGYNANDYIQITDPSGSIIWKSSDRYGGSHIYCSMQRTEPGVENLKYLPLRLIITDSDSDGKNEVITVKNYEITGGLLQQFRKFTKTHIESLSWNGLGLFTNWKTPETSGYISDFAIGDIDNDGADEIVASVILKDGAIIGTSPKSTLIMYELNK